MLYIIRHGQTALNKSHALQGRSDNPLNEQGIEQAREAAARLASQGVSFDRVISSPLVRAVQTAQIVVPGVSVEADERLIEMDYGPYEGADLRSPAPELAHFFADFVHNPAPEGMEPLSEVVRRVGTLVEELRGTSGNVLLSTHAIAMKAILEYLTPSSQGSYWSTFIGNCSVYVAETADTHIAVPHELGN